MLLGILSFAFWVSGRTIQILGPVISLPVALLGAFMILYGVGKWGQWAYLLIFFSIPASLFLAGGQASKELPIMYMITAAVASYGAVTGYYKWRREKKDGRNAAEAFERHHEDTY